MFSNYTGLFLGILSVVLLTGLTALASGYIYLMAKHSCPQCRTMISRKAAVCPHCGKGFALAAK